MYFPVADINLHPLAPFLIGLAVSALSSPTGISGGFLILPICVNFLGFTGLAVSPTNFIFNVVAMPPGLWRLWREKRLMWSLGLVLMLGSLPGIFAGTVLRATWLRDPASFKIFVALVLSALALNLMHSLWRQDARTSQAEKNFLKNARRPSSGLQTARQGPTLTFQFGGEDFALSIPHLTLVSLVVGLAGGIYGIGGAAIIAPLLISWFRLPIYVAAGASLMAGWAGAVFGLFSYAVFWPLVSGLPAVSPDFRLGLLFGLGGMLGVYTGSALQRYLPPRPLKMLMFLLVALMALENFGLF